MALKGFGTTAKPSFGFGAPASTQSSTLNFGASVANSKPSTFTGASTCFPTPSSGGVFGVASTAATSTLATTATTGVLSSSTAATSTTTSNKDETVPDEICKDVATFKEYVKKQKEESNEIARFSVKSLHKINDEISNLSNALSTISSAVQRNKAAVEKLGKEFATELHNAEMSHHTQNLSPALQHDNVSPVRYFMELVSQFQTNMQTYQAQIDELEKHLLAISKPSSLTPQDISIALCKMQDSFVTIAANLHSIHGHVVKLKDQYLAYRKLMYGDTTDVFASSSDGVPNKVAKSSMDNLSNVVALAMASVLQPQSANAVQQQTFAAAKPAAFGAATGGSLFGGSATPASGGLFGGKSATAGGLFGTAAATTAGGGLFGAKTTTSTNLFGATSTTPAPAAKTPFFGFGATSTAATTANPLKPTLSAGLNSTASSNTNVFFGGNSSTFNSSAGVTFGGSAARAPGFDLKLPAGNKRNKK